MKELTEEVTRRTFLQKSSRAVFGAGLGMAATKWLPSAFGQQPESAAKKVGANQKIVVGCIGVGSMGTYNLNDFKRDRRVEIAAICDVYRPHVERGLKIAGDKAKGYKDYREVLDRKDIDAVVISTPDHWHALPMINACQAGKDVYCEKPASLTVAEGRTMVNAAQKYHRVVQFGTQQRSGTHYHSAVKLIQEGKLGKISFVRAWNFGNQAPQGIGRPPDSEPPEGLDWDFWLGPAPKAPFNPAKFLGNFRWFWDYSGGKLTDWGTHHFDTIQWAMNVKAPVAVSGGGGKFGLDDIRETPDTLEVVYEYPGFIATFANRDGNGRDRDGEGYGIEFYGTNGSLFLDRGGWEVFPEGGAKNPRMQAEKSKGSDQHWPHVQNFLDCVQSRQLPRSDVETTHRATSVCHLANIALRTGRKIKWDADKEQVIGDREANAKLRRPYRLPWKLPKI